MATHSIQATYKALEEAAKKFLALHDEVNRFIGELHLSHQGLNGEWLGFGKKSFDNEFLDLSHGLSDLKLAMRHASRLLTKIRTEFEQTELEGAHKITTLLAPPRNMAELVNFLDKMYEVTDHAPYKDNEYIDEPVRIVEIGDGKYVVFINGTDGDKNPGGNDWPANGNSGRGVPSKYQEYVKELINREIPLGSEINLVGHSQGGHVVMNLADTQSLASAYNITSVSTFGASGSSTINPVVGAENYHNYLFSDDPIGVLEDSNYGPLSILNPLTGVAIAYGFPGSGFLAPSIDPIILPESMDDLGTTHPADVHNSYELSTTLQETPLPFEIDYWEEVGSYEAGPETYSNLRPLSAMLGDGIHHFQETPLQSAYQIATAVEGIATEVALTTWVATGENIVNTVSQILPQSWGIAIDNQVDQIGSAIANRPSALRLFAQSTPV